MNTVKKWNEEVSPHVEDWVQDILSGYIFSIASNLNEDTLS